MVVIDAVPLTAWIAGGPGCGAVVVARVVLDAIGAAVCVRGCVDVFAARAAARSDFNRSSSCWASFRYFVASSELGLMVNAASKNGIDSANFFWLYSARPC